MNAHLPNETFLKKGCSDSSRTRVRVRVRARVRVRVRVSRPGPPMENIGIRSNIFNF